MARDILKIMGDIQKAYQEEIKRTGIKRNPEADRVLSEYRKKFGVIPADGGFSIEAAKECIHTGKEFYSTLPDNIIP